MLALHAWSSTFPYLTYLKTFPSTSFSKTLSLEKRAALEEKIQELALKMGITKPIELVEAPESALPFSSFGSNIIPLKMGIFISPKAMDELKLSDDECEFLLAHEIAHLQSNDEIKLTALRVVASAITTVALGIIFPDSLLFDFPLFITIPASLLIGPLSLASIGGFAAGALFSLSFVKQIEKRADLRGFHHSSPAEKQASPGFFQKFIGLQLGNRENPSDTALQKRLLSWIISPEGNNRLDVVHPPLTERVRYMKDRLAKST